MRWSFAFYLVTNAKIRVHMITIFLANARATQIKKDAATLGCSKMPNSSIRVISVSRYKKVSVAVTRKHGSSQKTK